MINPVRIGNCLVGPGQPSLIIAEAGVNHNGDISRAHRLIDSAVIAGADAIKFQSFVTTELVTPGTPKAGYQMETTGQAGSQFEMLKALELSHQDHAELKTHCDDAGIMYLCTPYETISIDMLYDIGVAAFKVASTDTTNIPFLRYMAQKRLPVILSTGMCNLCEVERAITELISSGANGKIVILHCTSEYPAPFEDVNLRAMRTMEYAFSCPVGFSDHTTGIGAGTWAVALGACVVEKHFTLDRNLKGPDHRASIEPNQLRNLVKEIRRVEAAIGNGIKRPRPSEIENKAKMQKSIVIAKDITAGEVITDRMITCKRPGTGMSPLMFDQVVGQIAAKNLKKDTLLELSDIIWSPPEEQRA